jgi:hypothetical protein
MARMPVASLLTDLVTAGGMVVVLGMAALLIVRGTRKRDEDHDPDDR